MKAKINKNKQTTTTKSNKRKTKMENKTKNTQKKRVAYQVLIRRLLYCVHFFCFVFCFLCDRIFFLFLIAGPYNVDFSIGFLKDKKTLGVRF